jgi:hypothetical protein
MAMSCIGTPAGGTLQWRTEEGVTLKDLREKILRDRIRGLLEFEALMAAA